VVNINGDAIGRSVGVGGLFHTTGKVKLEEGLSVGGAAEVGGTIEAESVKVGGAVRAESVVASRSIETHKIRTVKGAKADRIEIDRRGEALGPLVGREVVLQRGAYAEDVWGDRVVLLRGARARNVYAGVFEAEEGSDVTGSILFTVELLAERGCHFTAQPAKAEKLPDRPI
jgi:cytoskeletal protein CcmA (bactofilin family)